MPGTVVGVLHCTLWRSIGIGIVYAAKGDAANGLYRSRCRRIATNGRLNTKKQRADGPLTQPYELLDSLYVI